ncbi:TetR/AcrR family transcriptional regulator [Gorillibacterium timonense]|uniref:TetR/AcrR family transcriptional regulator n=1 Tax=Gorillibacterium timonense TaxID=1689269 RepID=UPI00071C2AA6|nr:TetR/AcrR family transcriptional regulator [Gorillibacterium timonense]
MSPRIGLDQKAVLSSAAELADTQGFDAVTLASLAQKLNIRTPSLYNHVAGLPELKRLLALDGLKQLTELLSSALNDGTDSDAATTFCLSYVRFARQHPGLYEAVQRAPEPQDELLAEAGGQVVHFALTALSGYGLTEEEAIHAVRGLRSLLHGFVYLESIGGFGLPYETDRTLHFIVETYLSGLRKQS